MKLRELPSPSWARDLHGETEVYTTQEVRAIQLQAARDALEEAAKVCDEQSKKAYTRWRNEAHSYDDGGCDMANMLSECIRVIPLEQP